MLCLDETMKNAPRHRRVNMSGGDAAGFYLTRFFRKMMALVTFSLPVSLTTQYRLLPLFLVGFIYFKTPFHTRLTLTRRYTV